MANISDQGPFQRDNPRMPSSQKSADRPISFILVDSTNTSGAIQKSDTLTLYIRPEDLTHTKTSRINVQQTLGGRAWADNFGPGVPTINISGHTGWRRPLDPAVGSDDGAARFEKLKNRVFADWHARRLLAVQSGKDPDLAVQLQFVDQLDSITAVVAPLSFVLRRSRSRPLLMQYQLSMIVTQELVGTPPKDTFTLSGVITNAQKTTGGLTSLLSSIDTITAQINQVKNYIDKSIATPIAHFMQQTNSVLVAITNAVNSAQGVTNSLIAVGQLSAQCAVNVFRTLAAVAGLPQFVKSQIMGIAGAYSNAFCVLRNVFSQQLLYSDYQPLYGSSNCSSTNGGTPPSALAGLNTFEYTNPQQVADSVTVTSQARVALKTLSTADPVLAPPTIAQLGNLAGTAANGIAVAA